MDGESFFNNRGHIEESQIQISKLIERLHKDSLLERHSDEVSNLITGMESILGHFSNNQYELQNEIEEILESSRRGALTHEKLVEMIQAEQVRSKYLSSIVGSLKDQIENLYVVLTTASNESEDGEPIDVLDMVSNNVSLLWKSVDSLSKIIVSPTKKLESTLSKIDSEVIVHMNKSMYLKDNHSSIDLAEKIDQDLRTHSRQKELSRTKSNSSHDTFSVQPSEGGKSKRIKSEDSHPSKNEGHSTSSQNAENGNSFAEGQDNISLGNDSSSKKYKGPNLKPIEIHKSHPHNKNQPNKGNHDPSAYIIPEVITIDSSQSFQKKINHHNKDDVSVTSQQHEDDHSLNSYYVDQAHQNYQLNHNNRPLQDSENIIPDLYDVNNEHPDNNTAKRNFKNNINNNISESNNLDKRISNQKNKNKDNLNESGNQQSNKTPLSNNSKANRNSANNKNKIKMQPLILDDDSSVEMSIVAPSFNDDWLREKEELLELLRAKDNLLQQKEKEIKEAVTKGVKDYIRNHGLTPTNKRTPTNNINKAFKEIRTNKAESDLNQSLLEDEPIVINDSLALTSLAPDISLEQQDEYGNTQPSTSLFLNSSTLDYPNDSSQVNRDGSAINRESSGEKNLSLDKSKPNRPKDAGLYAWKINKGVKLAPINSENQDNLSRPRSRQKVLRMDSTRGLGSPNILRRVHEEVKYRLERSNTASSEKILYDDKLQEIITIICNNIGIQGIEPESWNMIRIGTPSNYNTTGNNVIPAIPKASSGPLVPISIDLLDNSIQPIILPDRFDQGTSTDELTKGNDSNEISNGFNPDQIDNTSLKVLIANPDSLKIGTKAFENKFESAVDINQPDIRNTSQSTSSTSNFINNIATSNFNNNNATNTNNTNSNINTKGNTTNNNNNNYNLQSINNTNNTSNNDNYNTRDERNLPNDSFYKSRTNSSNMNPNFETEKDIIPIHNPIPEVLGKFTEANESATFSVDNFKLNQSMFSQKSSKSKELPIYDNQSDILVTRTYKSSIELMSFREHIQNSDTPILSLFNEFQDCLTIVQKTRLLTCGFNPINPLSMNANYCEALLQNIRDLESIIDLSLPKTGSFEDLVNNMVRLIKLFRKSSDGFIEIEGNNGQIMRLTPDHEFIYSNITNIFHILGDLEAEQITNSFRLLEYRALFENIQKISVKELSRTLAESPILNDIYNIFTKLSGQILEIHQRLVNTKQRCNKYQLHLYIAQSNTSRNSQWLDLDGGSNSPGGNQSPLSFFTSHVPFSMAAPAPPSMNLNEMSNMNKQHFNSSVGQGGYYNDEILQKMENALKAAHEEIEDLDAELLDIIKSKDKTPTAILFFSVLHDPNIIPNLQQLTLQFQHLRHFVENTQTIDFIMLRKRLQVCLVLMPSIDKLIDKYHQLYQQWSKYRLNWFAMRKVRGSAADELASCPLCYHDLNEETPPSDQSSLSRTGQTNRKANKKLLTKVHQVSQSQSMPQIMKR